MLIRVGEDSIYNTETGCCIHRVPFTPFLEGVDSNGNEIRTQPSITFDGHWLHKGEIRPVDIFFSEKIIDKAWDTLCEVADLQLDSLRLRSYDEP